MDVRPAGSALLAVLIGASSVAAAETGDDHRWNWTFGVNERFRTEYRRDFDLNEDIKDNGKWFFNRLKLNGTLQFLDGDSKERAELFMEGMQADVAGYDLKAPSNQKDRMDFHQGYLHLFDILGSGFEFKGGRMEANYGNGRLIAQPGWGNRMRHFDGGMVGYHRQPLHVDALYLRDVKYDDRNFNRSFNNEFLTGVYGRYQEHKTAPLVELYYLLQENKIEADIERRTIGTRLQGFLPFHILGEVEIPFQFGRNGGRDIKAYALNVSMSRAWDTGWKPKIYFEFNLATGDKDAADDEVNTFIPLYQSTHDPYGLLDYFRWQNMKEVAWKLDVFPIEKWKFTPQVNVFWLENKNDNWYSASGSVIRSKINGERDDYVGTEVSLRAYYDMNKYVKLETGYAHFFTGSYVKDSGAHDDVDWVYSQITFKY